MKNIINLDVQLVELSKYCEELDIDIEGKASSTMIQGKQNHKNSQIFFFLLRKKNQIKKKKRIHNCLQYLHIVSTRK